VKRQRWGILFLDQMPCTDLVQKIQRVGISCYEEMLSVVDLIACGRIAIGSRTTAECGALFEEMNGNSGRAEVHGGREPAESAADDYNWRGSACFHNGPRFNQEYFSLWLSQ